MGGEGGNAWLGKNRRWKLITQILKNMTRIPLISNFWQQILSQSVWKYKRRMLGQLRAGWLSNALGSIKHQLELDWNKSDRYLLKWGLENARQKWGWMGKKTWSPGYARKITGSEENVWDSIENQYLWFEMIEKLGNYMVNRCVFSS